MKKSILFIITFCVISFNHVYSQTLTCLTPTLVMSDPTVGPAAISPTISCDFAGLIRFNSSPSSNTGPTAGNKPCLRFFTSVTNPNSLTNNTLCLGEGTASLCTNPANSSFFTYYVYGLTPSLAHTYTMCNNLIAANMTYSVASCYDNTIITSGTWTNTSAASCQTILIPANTPIGGASFVITPTVIPAAISQNNNNGFIDYDPNFMSAGVYTVTYTFSTPSCSTSASRTFEITNPYVGAGSSFSVPASICPTGPCINLNSQLFPSAWGPGTWSGTGVSSNSFCPSATGPGTFQITYSVGITPACSATNSNIYVVSPTPTANAGTTKSITCAISSQTLNGLGGGTYSWSHGTLGNGFSTAQNPVIGNQTGTYTLVVSNGTCFSSPATVSVVNNFVAPALPAIAVSSTINCINTTATVTATGSGVTYTWSGPSITSGNGTATITANVGGTYNYTVTSTSNGCTSNSNVAVSQNTAVPLNITSGAAINCTNNISSLNANQPGYSYTWTAPSTGNINSGQSTATVLITGTGIYTVTVQNPANGCFLTTTVVPTTNTTVITPNITNTPVITCNNPTATLNSTPGSGVTYTWSTTGGNIISSTNIQNAGINSGGTYTLAVTNTTNGCIGTRTITITTNTVPPSALNINPNTVVLACPAQTAVLTGSATGATSFSWTAPSVGSILSGASTATALVTSSGVGVFTMVATAANGCSSIITATVSPNTNAPTFSLSNGSPSITCANNSPSVSVNLTSTVAILSYSWNPSTGISGPTNTSVVTFTAAGSYTAIITATNGCISTAVVPVGTATTPPSVVAGTGTAQILSCTNSVVTISPSFTPASSNYTYTWSGPGIVGSTNNSSVQVNQTGTYSLSVTNTLTGCSSAAFTVPVTGNNTTPDLNVSSSSSVGIGCSPSTSTVNLTATSTVAVSYNWSTGATTAVISTNIPGIYTITVTDNSNNCSTTQTIAVANSSTSPAFTATPAGTLPCGSSNGTVVVNAVSSNTNISYTWFGNGIVSGSNTANASINSAGIYTVVALDITTGCSTTSTLIIAQPTVVANFSVSVLTGMAPLSVDFTNNSLGATTYSWTFGNGSVSTSTNPSNVYPTSGNYTVTLVSSNGLCSDTYTLEIKVTGGLGSIPQIFTPNGDGKNDPFYIPGLDNYPKNKLQIFNRWGNIVYEAAPYKNDWDGSPNKTSMGTGKLPVGTYFYILDLGVETEEVRKGFVQLEY